MSGPPVDCHGPGLMSRCSKSRKQMSSNNFFLFPLEVYYPNPHQVVGVIDCYLSDGGAAWICQVGVTMVDRECT